MTNFRGRALPEKAGVAGYAALIERYGLELPLPTRLAAIAERHHPTSTIDWLLLTPRHRPEPTLSDQLSFALKWEGVQLLVLARLFKAVSSEELVAVVRASPTGTFARRIWFLFEWLTGEELPIADPGRVKLVPVVDPQQQFALATGQPSRRHKVLNNLPGTPAFCPMVSRTSALAAQSAKALDQRARAAIGRIRPDLVARAAAFLLLNDSKSSFAIEGEKPSGTRTARWGQAIAQAGTRHLSLGELDRLQRIVIGDDRFVRLGLRVEGGFVGVHDRINNHPIPDHVSARAEDLEALISGLVAFDERTLAGQLDPVVAAAALAFGFVYIHPYEDGNGRLHRWLIHHALAAARYNPPGLVFPISAVILRRLNEYKAVLESYSRPLLPHIHWRPTTTGNVEVLDDTADFYRYFDATAHADFLYSCVEQTIEQDLPSEVAFLEAFERFSDGVQQIVDMPATRIELLRKFLEQGRGRLSQRAREREFAALTAAETQRIEQLYGEAFAPEARRDEESL
ncbi:MAG TPA: Fic family protein [Allosphingosinicella sp.]